MIARRTLETRSRGRLLVLLLALLLPIAFSAPASDGRFEPAAEDYEATSGDSSDGDDASDSSLHSPNPVPRLAVLHTSEGAIRLSSKTLSELAPRAPPHG